VRGQAPHLKKIGFHQKLFRKVIQKTISEVFEQSILIYKINLSFSSEGSSPSLEKDWFSPKTF